MPAIVHVFQRKKRRRREYGQKYGYDRCSGGELANLACDKVA